MNGLVLVLFVNCVSSFSATKVHFPKPNFQSTEVGLRIAMTPVRIPIFWFVQCLLPTTQHLIEP